MAKQNPVSAKRAVVTSFLVSVGDIFINVVAAILTGSAVVLAQALQGFADLTSAGFLLIGVKSAERKPTEKHPLGFGRELFFWVLLAGVFMFTVTGGLAIFIGIGRILSPTDIDNIPVALGVVIFGLVTNFYSFMVSAKRIRGSMSASFWWRKLRKSSMIETKTTLLVDFLGSLAALLAFVSMIIYIITDNSFFDGLGSILIGLLTMAGALLLIMDLRGLIIGRTPPDTLIKEIRQSILKNRNLNDVLDLDVITIGSGKQLVIAEVHFKDNLDTDKIEMETDKIKDQVMKDVDSVARIQVEAETP